VTLGRVNIEQAIAQIREHLARESALSPALRSAIELLILIVTLLAKRAGLNSRNSSTPPSGDPHRPRQKRKGATPRGGQTGHDGITLRKVAHPDRVEVIAIDRRTLPRGTYQEAGFEARQVIDLEVTRVVTEYRAQVLQDPAGNRYVAPFPAQVSRPVQYGVNVKAHAVYMSQFQLVPYNRIQDHFQDQLGMSLSAGSVFNFNQEAYERLEEAEQIAKRNLIAAALAHADETGINVDGQRLWLHSVSTAHWTYFYPHAKRGTEAMEAMGVLPKFRGVLCHDHWKPYYTYSCTHALCNAHHLRELERAFEQDGQRWAQRMKKLLEEMNEAVKRAGGVLAPAQVKHYRQCYRRLLGQADKECPAAPATAGRRGRVKQTTARNLLDRLRNYQDDVLRFLDTPGVPFTNNQGENDIRMTKVQQKISGCFRSLEGAFIFCRIRGYLSTCRKNGVAPTEALRLLFEGKLPAFFYDATPPPPAERAGAE
jgi:transposase